MSEHSRRLSPYVLSPVGEDGNWSPWGKPGPCVDIFYSLVSPISSL